MTDRTTADLLAGLERLPLIDAHTHLVDGRLAARGLHDLLLYHMMISDLYSAGCPSGARLTEYPGWAAPAEASSRIEEALPFLERIASTSCSWMLRRMLGDLYDWRQPITATNWRQLDGIIRERADDRVWQREIMKRTGVERYCTESARRNQGKDDDILSYAMEWAFFARYQWGEFDTAVYELEKCWGHKPSSPTPIGISGRPAPERTIRTLDDARAAMTHYVTNMPIELITATATTISTDLDLRPVTDAEMTTALARRAQAGERERDIYAAWINELFLTELERRAPQIVFQFAFGAEPLPFETGSIIPQRSIGQAAAMIARHPRLHFMCFLASRHANQSMCTLSRELPNLSLAGYWWHNFFPGTIRQVMEERLDMLPLNRQVGFFSDAYCLEWSYAKAGLVRSQLAQVLAQKVAQGQYTSQEALGFAAEIFARTTRDLLHLPQLIAGAAKT